MLMATESRPVGRGRISSAMLLSSGKRLHAHGRRSSRYAPILPYCETERTANCFEASFKQRGFRYRGDRAIEVTSENLRILQSAPKSTWNATARSSVPAIAFILNAPAPSLLRVILKTGTLSWSATLVRARVALFTHLLRGCGIEVKTSC